MRVKCLAQEHNAMTPARARTLAARPGDERTNHEATAASTLVLYSKFIVESATKLLIGPLQLGSRGQIFLKKSVMGYNLKNDRNEKSVILLRMPMKVVKFEAPGIKG